MPNFFECTVGEYMSRTFGNRQHGLVTAAAADQRQANASVASRGFKNGGTGAQLPRAPPW